MRFCKALRMVAPTPLQNSNTQVGGICALTGTSVSDWVAHTASFEYRMAHALAHRLTNSHTPLRVKDVWSELSNPTRLVDELCSNSRLGNLSTTMRFLCNHNVLLHSLLRFHASTNTWNVTGEFGRTSFVGECLLRSEATSRLVKLIPDVEYDILRQMVDAAMSPKSLSGFYDVLCLNRLLEPAGRRKVKVTEAHKTRLVLAALGEMHWFSVKTKATDRTHNNALFPPSDVLILHVLCCHCVEVTIVELLMSVIRPALRQLVKRAWTNFHTSTPEQLRLKPRTIGKMSLNLEPTLKSSSAISHQSVEQTRLESKPLYSSVTSLAKTKVNYKMFDRLPVKASPLALRPSKSAAPST
jgi:hypothetical protein